MNELMLNGRILWCTSILSASHMKNLGVCVTDEFLKSLTHWCWYLCFTRKLLGILKVYHVGTKCCFFTQQGSITDHGQQNKIKPERQELAWKVTKKLWASFLGLLKLHKTPSETGATRRPGCRQGVRGNDI